MARETRRLGGARTTGGVEGALTGSASAGIRALQILLVREPATGIGGEGGGGGGGERALLGCVIFDVGAFRVCFPA